MKKPDDLARAAYATRTLPEQHGREVRPTHGYIQYFARVSPGERWPEVFYRVHGTYGTTCLLRRDGTWFYVAPNDYYIVPDECTLRQRDLGEAIAAAGIISVLPLCNDSHDVSRTPIEYGTPSQAATCAVAKEEWKPRAPRWRGGKPWV